MDSSAGNKPTKYYIDFENVHGPGLKGVDELGEQDEVLVFYSQAAETFHIEQAIDIMKSKATVKFVEIDGGTRNSLDFQLVAALFGTMDDEHDYAIVSGDGGFDAAIRMGERLELPAVRRITDLTGSTESPQPKSTRSRRSRSKKSNGDAKADAKAEQEKQPGSSEAGQASAQSGQDGQKHAGAADAAPAAKSTQPGQEGHGGKKDQKEPAKTKEGNAKAEKKLPAAKAQAQLPPPAADAHGAAGDDSAAADASEGGAEADPNAAAPAKSGRYSKRKEIKAMLAEHGVVLNQQQLSSVMKALNGVKNKQGFYRAIIQEEKQERGLELYRQVRDYYEPMVEALRG